VTTGQEVAIEYWRDGERRSTRARAASLPEKVVDELGEQLLGLRLRAGGEAGGFVVESVRSGSGAEEIGIQRGDRILGINGRRLSGPEELRRAVLDLRGRDRALVVVQRGPGRYHVAIPLS
jgi:serine protease Do